MKLQYFFGYQLHDQPLQHHQRRGEECAMVVLALEANEDCPLQEWIVPGTYEEFTYDAG